MEKDIPELNIGIVGHIDHGKTTLLEKLTGKNTDTHSEELKRGITIKLGYADLLLKKQGNEYGKQGEAFRYISFVDAPGHEMLMATMLSGAAIMDAAILVIAANEGIKPQTREHLTALGAKNIKQIIIIQNKIDLVDKEQAKKNYKEIKEFVKGTIAENSKIIPISAQQEINLEEVYKTLGEIEIPKRNLEEKPLFLIARSFDINRPGSEIKGLKGGILGGIIKKGVLKIGDEIEIKPGLSEKKDNKFFYKTLKTKISAIFKGKDKIQEAKPGSTIALETELDPKITKADSLSGCIASIPNELPEITSNIKISYKLFKEVLGIEEHKEVEDIKTNELLMLAVNTTITVGQVLSAQKDSLELALKIPIVPLKGENIGIARNFNSHWRLIGFGEII